MVKLFSAILFSLVIFTQSVFAESSQCNIKPGDPLKVDTFSSLAEKVSPSVVSISTSINYRAHMPPGFEDDPFFNLFQGFGLAPQPPMRDDSALKDPKRFQPVGTGFIIEPDGLILTNFHVIENADTVYVHLPNDQTKTYEAKVIGGDKRTDVAIIKINAGRALPTLPLGDSDKVKQGEWVSAFGDPIGLEFTQTKGIISAKGRRIQELNSIPFLQTDASINPGNSGGPLTNLCGEAIGINSAVAASAQGIGFAIPINHVKSILPSLKKIGRVIRGYVGVYVDNISPRAKAVLKLPTSHGALVMGVMGGGPAEKAGLKAYDVVTKVDDTDVDSSTDLIDAIRDYPIGKTAKVEFLRGGKKLATNLTIANPPDESRPVHAAGPRKAHETPFTIGFKVADYSEKIAKELGVSSQLRGPIVTDVEAGSPASQNGLRVGDVILDVNQNLVHSAKDVFSYLKKGNNILRVQNHNEVSLIFLDL